MCHIWNCFTWIIDIIQRILTCMLAFILCLVIFLALSIAILAGIAYGYNFSITEYLTFTKSDVTVYIRRGQFVEPPELPFQYRRAGGGEAGDEENMFVSNSSTDYQNPNVGSDVKELSDSWKLAQDTRSYAQKLTRYEGAKPGPGPRRSNDDDVNSPDDVDEAHPAALLYTPPAVQPIRTTQATTTITRTEASIIMPTRTLHPVTESNKYTTLIASGNLVAKKGEKGLDEDSVKQLTEDLSTETSGVGIDVIDIDDEYKDSDQDQFRKSSRKRKRKHKHRKQGSQDFYERRFIEDSYYSEGGV